MTRQLPALAAALAAACLALPPAAAQAQTAPLPSQAEMAQILQQLSTELAEMKTQVRQLQQERDAARAAAAPVGAAVPTTAGASAAPAAATAAITPAPATGIETAAAAAAPAQPATVLSSYGEINYSRPTNDSAKTQADMVRFVLGYQHRFDERTKVVAELELEHAVASAEDAGEVALEQAFVERQFNLEWAGQAGLFLMPIGLLNGNHEPIAYYGVWRNFVETAIIPSTWREGGLQAIGTFDSGITVNVGVSTGFDVGQWDASSSDCGASPLGCIHQEMALARAKDIAVFGRLDWRGVPGLLLGGSIFSGGASQAQDGVASSRVTLGEVHARWQPGRWDLAALATYGSISNSAELNRPQVGNPVLIPESFAGWYVLAAYRLWQDEDYTLSPFARFEQYNTGRSYADLGAGLTPPALPTQQVITVGVDFKIGQGIVFKGDYQGFKVDSKLNRVSLGLGWNF